MSILRRTREELRYALSLRSLPTRVAWFQWRARRVARRTDDQWSPVAVTRPADLSILLELAAGRRRVVELGTASGWTAISLAIADPAREVLTYDRHAHSARERYLALIDASVRERITMIEAPGASGPSDARPIDLLYVDSSHALAETIEEWHAWRPALRPGAVVAFDDYVNPDFPGVRAAIAELGLPGSQRGTMFVHVVPG